MKFSLLSQIKGWCIFVAAAVVGWWAVSYRAFTTDPMPVPLRAPLAAASQSKIAVTSAIVPPSFLTLKGSPSDYSVLLLRLFFSRKSSEEGAEWIRGCDDEMVKQLALAAFVIEHPNAAAEFFAEADGWSKQQMLLGWSQSDAGRVLAMIRDGTCSEEDTTFFFSVLLETDYAGAMAAMSAPSSKTKNVSSYALSRWAESDSEGVARAFAMGKSSGIDYGLLWQAISTTYLNERQPWFWNEVVKSWSPDQAAAASAWMKDDYYAMPSLVSSIGLNPRLSAEVIANIPGAAAELVIVSMGNQGSLNAQDVVAAGLWTEEQGRRFAKLAANRQGLSEHLLASAETPATLRAGLIRHLAAQDPVRLAELTTVSVPDGIAAAVRAAQLTEYWSALPQERSRPFDELFPTLEAWTTAGLNPKQAFSLASGASPALKDPIAWATNAMAAWLPVDSLAASHAVNLLPAGPLKEAAAEAVFEYSFNAGDQSTALRWLGQVSSEKRESFLQAHPNLKKP